MRRDMEWLTVSTFFVILLLVSFSGFKLPHYLNIIFPVASIMAAVFIVSAPSPGKWIRPIFIIQLSVSVLLLITVAVINAWAFPVKSIWVVIVLVILLAVVFYFIKSKMYSPLQKAVLVPVAVMILSFFLLNTNFYPQLLKYQGGNQLATKTMGRVDPGEVYLWKETQSSSFNFYTKTFRKGFRDSLLDQRKSVWLLYDIKDGVEVKDKYRIGQRFETLDYEITKLDLKFMDPAKRESQCSRMIVAEIAR